MKALVRDIDKGSYLKGDVIIIVPDNQDFSPKDLEGNRVIILTESHLKYDLKKEKESIEFNAHKARIAMAYELQPKLMNRRRFYFDENDNIKRR